MFPFVIALVLFFGSFHSTVDACTRVLGPDNGQAVVVGRTMDWFEDIKTNLWVFPRGIERDGLAGKNSLHWTSKYGSLIASIYDIGTVDGMNEKGLVANTLYLAESNYGKRDEKIPGLSISLWAQYFLDNFSTVDEAVRTLSKHPLQITTGMLGSSGKKAQGHLALSDAKGDSAIIEYVDGKMVLYHGRQYRIMTNSPTFDKQLANLKQYKGFGGTAPLPGTTQAADRFVRAAYYESHLPKPTNKREAVGGVLSVMRNAAQPFGTPDPERPNIAPTIWTSVSNATDRVYFFEKNLSPNIIWVKLNKLDFKKGAPILKLDLVKNADRIGDVTGEFKPAASFQFLSL